MVNGTDTTGNECFAGPGWKARMKPQLGQVTSVTRQSVDPLDERGSLHATGRRRFGVFYYEIDGYEIDGCPRGHKDNQGQPRTTWRTPLTGDIAECCGNFRERQGHWQRDTD